ncbi:hypothetical protein CMUS01_01962 [Colletotrichum musicola]|uniref:Uncharacterized protein n=1 Tax=Colletotrichum musicola TaxID=2175873 RepID=A0A8H6U7G3_9PEZI|nr:hypothetical protein CMUS01_01962 [Colletotrichum musicola]
MLGQRRAARTPSEQHAIDAPEVDGNPRMILAGVSGRLAGGMCCPVRRQRGGLKASVKSGQILPHGHGPADDLQRQLAHRSEMVCTSDLGVSAEGAISQGPVAWHVPVWPRRSAGSRWEKAPGGDPV